MNDSLSCHVKPQSFWRDRQVFPVGRENVSSLGLGCATVSAPQCLWAVVDMGLRILELVSTVWRGSDDNLMLPQLSQALKEMLADRS